MTVLREVRAAAQTRQTLRLRCASGVPVLTECGALVVEATLPACVAAWMLARGGCRTVLVSSGSSLAHELVVVRQPWTREEQWEALPEAFKDVMRTSIDATLANGEHLLNLAKVALGIEDLLLDAGVRLFYGLAACGVEKGAKGVIGSVVFGGKSGFQAVKAQRVIDATQGAVVAGLAGARVLPRVKPGGRVAVGIAAKVKQSSRPGPIAITRGQISEDRLEALIEESLPAPEVEELVGGSVGLHGPYAQISLSLPVDLSDPLWMARLTVATRRSLVRVGGAAQKERERAGKNAVYWHRFSGGLALGPVVRVVSGGAGSPYGVAGSPNLWVCGAAADVDEAEARGLAEPFEGSRACEALVAGVLAAKVLAPGEGRLVLGKRVTGSPKATGEMRFADAPALHAREHVPMPEEISLPVMDQSDVLVVGAGTSGVPSALAAARGLARTTLVDQHADVGGVRTIGGVGSYWFGRPTDFQNGCDGAYDKVTAVSGVAEEVAMMQCLLDAGVEMLPACPVAGVAVRGDTVLGVVIITSCGLAVVTGKVVVDATGDADLAAWAGAPFEYGNGRDAFTLWGSFGNFNHHKRTSNRQYESTIEVRDPWDFTRNIIRGRRRPGMWKSLDHEMPQHYVTPRETRRILAGATVTYSGIMAGETFDDLMVVCESNFDIKGLATSDIGACGVVSSWDVYKKFQAAVPWRAVQPAGLANVLVAGRAYSASHDAIALARMQRDMVSLGGAVGWAAARAALTEVPASALDVKSLQKQWLDLGTLRADDFKHYAKPWRYAGAEAQKDCEGLLGRRGLWNHRAARLMRTSASLPALRRAFKAATHGATRVRLARALCSLGDRRGVPLLLETIAAQTAKGLPRPLKKHLAIPPEHGWAGEPVYSLRAIGLAGAGDEAAAAMIAIARKIEDNAERFASQTDSQFEYVHGICYVAERCPGPAMLGPLNVLWQRRSLRGLSLPWERDMRFTVDPTLERRAYLEMCIGRALARCGDARGYEVLMRYADDVRGTLARSACDELKELMGSPPPVGAAQRHEALKRHLQGAIKCVPVTKRID